jgi:aspartyl/glutamyl-tRNA(Asn/Gln) amidotransferase C subunit
MEITPQLFDHIAHLSRLEFSSEEKQAIRQDMQKMVTFFEQLNHLDVSGVAPLGFLSNVQQEMREDIHPRFVSHEPERERTSHEPEDSHESERTSHESEDSHEPTAPKYYTVPKVIENTGA